MRKTLLKLQEEAQAATEGKLKPTALAEVKSRPLKRSEEETETTPQSRVFEEREEPFFDFRSTSDILRRYVRYKRTAA